MNFGPLEFASYLQRDEMRSRDSAAVSAARSAAPVAFRQTSPLTILVDDTSRMQAARAAQTEGVSVYEAVAMGGPGTANSNSLIDVRVSAAIRRLVLVLSAHQAVHWQIALEPGATLSAVLVSGYGESTVAGIGDAMVSSIGGFYAFKQGSAEFRHLESEVMRCTGRNIENFQSVFAGSSFEIGPLSTAATAAAAPGAR
jgi:hypothetical protein